MLTTTTVTKRRLKRGLSATAEERISSKVHRPFPSFRHTSFSKRQVERRTFLINNPLSRLRPQQENDLLTIPVSDSFSDLQGFLPFLYMPPRHVTQQRNCFFFRTGTLSTLQSFEQSSLSFDNRFRYRFLFGWRRSSKIQLQRYGRKQKLFR